MKITMVGKSGSGKTTYMAALHEVLGVRRVKDFGIDQPAKNLIEAVSKKGKFEQLAFAARDFNFPPATQQTTLWSFDLLYGSRFVCNFEWIDYRGGILEDVFNPDLESDERKQKEVHELLGHIS